MTLRWYDSKIQKEMDVLDALLYCADHGELWVGLLVRAAQEIKDLRDENKNLKEENEILRGLKYDPISQRKSM
jgi:hypothetical protein